MIRERPSSEFCYISEITVVPNYVNMFLRELELSKIIHEIRVNHLR